MNYSYQSSLIVCVSVCVTVYLSVYVCVPVCLSVHVCCGLRFSPDGASIAVGSDDACVDIYTTADLTRTAYCRGIPSQVTHMDWSLDNTHLQVSVMVIMTLDLNMVWS